MRRLSPLLFVIGLGAQLVAQARLHGSDAAATNLIQNVAVHCNTVEHHSNSVPRIFARTTSAAGSSGWKEYGSKAAWNEAGRPQPVAFVWYQDSRIFRVAITANEPSDPLVYADYCYREDGSLARIRSMPSTQHNCEGNRYQCSLVLREARFYPPDGPAVTTFKYLNHGGYSTSPPDVMNGPLLPEQTVVTYVPMKWPEYRRVADLPFSGSLYATLR